MFLPNVQILIPDITCNTSANMWQCPGGNTSFVICIEDSQICDFVKNCPGSTDELPSACPGGEYRKIYILFSKINQTLYTSTFIIIHYWLIIIIIIILYIQSHLVYPTLVYPKTSFIRHSVVNHYHHFVYYLPLFIQHLVYPTHIVRNKCGRINQGPLYTENV